MNHEMTLTLLDRKLQLAPIGPAPQRVLDLGTGTGIVSQVYPVVSGLSPFSAHSVLILLHSSGLSTLVSCLGNDDNVQDLLSLTSVIRNCSLTVADQYPSAEVRASLTSSSPAIKG
jgi:hypothetical protein